ncbi:hypothetical protein CROQUDRAFT_717380 [Cronartium quercuum f. sp. fusiforme G11]|uniref:Secreted protein n=1 Tax=Cronartium quercuum f. sp. fusiforme G11 TaxID=708437 RepID=A0A9P6NG76_9BASI|nr:hypothetical protein CROQUDRAFT_717380 [Cronartium quercuum f. sp. fusiforme G11]
MKYSLLALFAPLFLIGLTTVCMAGHDIVADKSPRTTEEQYLYITNKIDFGKDTLIYSADGTAVYKAVLSAEKDQHYVTIQSIRTPSNSQKFNLPYGIDCKEATQGSYFLYDPKDGSSNKEWLLKDPDHQPEGSELYYPAHVSEPAGVIQASSATTAAQVAEISDVNSPRGLKGNYYCMYLVAPAGNLPLITPAEVIMFVYQILEAKNRCSKLPNKNRLG